MNFKKRNYGIDKLWHDTTTVVVGCTNAIAKVQGDYNCNVGYVMCVYQSFLVA